MAVLNQIKVAATTTRKVPTFDIGHVMWKEIKGIHRNMNCELELFGHVFHQSLDTIPFSGHLDTALGHSQWLYTLF